MDPRTAISRIGTELPRTTVVMVAHDQEHLVEGALDSMLRQEGARCLVNVIDDGSTDRTWEVIGRVRERHADGPHQLVASRFVERLGPRRLLDAIADAATPHVVVARSEDRSRPDRVNRLVHALESTGSCVVASEQARIGGPQREASAAGRRPESGIIPPHELALRLDAPMPNLGTMAMRPEVVRGFPVVPSARDAEDLAGLLAFRGALMGGCFHLDETLVDYRVGGPPTGSDFRSRETCREALLADQLSARVAMLQDLRSIPDPSVDSACTHIRLEASLKGALVELAERWSEARVRLDGAGSTPSRPARMDDRSPEVLDRPASARTWARWIGFLGRRAIPGKRAA